MRLRTNQDWLVNNVATRRGVLNENIKDKNKMRVYLRVNSSVSVLELHQSSVGRMLSIRGAFCPSENHHFVLFIFSLRNGGSDWLGLAPIVCQNVQTAAKWRVRGRGRVGSGAVWALGCFCWIWWHFIDQTLVTAPLTECGEAGRGPGCSDYWPIRLSTKHEEAVTGRVTC